MADTLTDAQIEELKELFNLFDRNQDGMIKTNDLVAVLRSLGQNPGEEETKILIAQVFIIVIFL